MKSGHILARRNVHERQVIACLRGGLTFELRDIPDAKDAFSNLADMAQRRGAVIFARESPFVGDAEIEILTRIAAAQRLGRRAPSHGGGMECDALLRCAMVLREAGIWLPLAASAGGSRRQPERGALARHRFAKGEAVRARALSLARSRQVASTEEFAAVGVSRQYVSQLCKNGYLERVRYGWYRAAPVSDRGFAADRYARA